MKVDIPQAKPPKFLPVLLVQIVVAVLFSIAFLSFSSTIAPFKDVIISISGAVLLLSIIIGVRNGIRGIKTSSSTSLSIFTIVLSFLMVFLPLLLFAVRNTAFYKNAENQYGVRQVLKAKYTEVSSVLENKDILIKDVTDEIALITDTGYVIPIGVIYQNSSSLLAFARENLIGERVRLELPEVKSFWFQGMTVPATVYYRGDNIEEVFSEDLVSRRTDPNIPFSKLNYYKSIKKLRERYELFEKMIQIPITYTWYLHLDEFGRKIDIPTPATEHGNHIEIGIPETRERWFVIINNNGNNKDPVLAQRLKKFLIEHDGSAIRVDSPGFENYARSYLCFSYECDHSLIQFRAPVYIDGVLINEEFKS